MSKLQIPLHGRNHRRGGSDPIPISNRMPNIHLVGSLDGVTMSHTTVDTDKLSFGSLLLPPINHSGTVDTDIFDITGGGPWDTVPILVPGLYYAETRCGWYMDWGAFRINLQYEHSNGEIFPVSDSWGFTDALPTELGGTYPGFGGFPHDQTAVRRGGFLLVDEYTFTSSGTFDVFATTTNTSGSDRTFDLTTNAGGCTLFIVRLSDSAHSNPV